MHCQESEYCYFPDHPCQCLCMDCELVREGDEARIDAGIDDAK
jgi:hypothetical protein